MQSQKDGGMDGNSQFILCHLALSWVEGWLSGEFCLQWGTCFSRSQDITIMAPVWQSQKASIIHKCKSWPNNSTRLCLSIVRRWITHYHFWGGPRITPTGVLHHHSWLVSFASEGKKNLFLRWGSVFPILTGTTNYMESHRVGALQLLCEPIFLSICKECGWRFNVHWPSSFPEACFALVTVSWALTVRSDCLSLLKSPVTNIVHY